MKRAFVSLVCGACLALAPMAAVAADEAQTPAPTTQQDAAPLKAGKPAGVQQARLTSTGTLWLSVAVVAVTAGAIALGSGGGHHHHGTTSTQ